MVRLFPLVLVFGLCACGDKGSSSDAGAVDSGAWATGDADTGGEGEGEGEACFNLVEKLILEDSDADGTTDESEFSAYSYDADGNITEIDITWDFDGVEETTQLDTFTYDTDGNVIEYVFAQDLDGDGDWETISTETHTYDTDGRLSYSVRIVSDTAIHADSRKTWTYTYDPDGNLTRIPHKNPT
jgi:YD repeat-containing protein